MEELKKKKEEAIAKVISIKKDLADANKALRDIECEIVAKHKQDKKEEAERAKKTSEEAKQAIIDAKIKLAADNAKKKAEHVKNQALKAEQKRLKAAEMLERRSEMAEQLDEGKKSKLKTIQLKKQRQLRTKK